MVIIGAVKKPAAAVKKVEEPKQEVKKVEVIEPTVIIEPIVIEEKIEESVAPIRKKAKKIIEEIEQEVAEQE